MNGRPLQGSDKGPLVLLYPFAARNALPAMAQVSEIEVLE
jgi:hypothetical protein